MSSHRLAPLRHCWFLPQFSPTHCLHTLSQLATSPHRLRRVLRVVLPRSSRLLAPVALRQLFCHLRCALAHNARELPTALKKMGAEDNALTAASAVVTAANLAGQAGPAGEVVFAKCDLMTLRFSQPTDKKSDRTYGHVTSCLMPLRLPHVWCVLCMLAWHGMAWHAAK